MRIESLAFGVVLLASCVEPHAGADAGSRDAAAPTEPDAAPTRVAPAAWALPEPIDAVAVDSLGTVFAMGRLSTLWAFHADGSLVFERSDLGYSSSEGRHSLVGAERGVIVSTSDAVTSLDEHGSARWTTAVEGACAIARGTAGRIGVVTPDDVAVLDERTGAIVARIDDGPRVTTECGLAGGRRRIIAGAPDGSWVVAPPLNVLRDDGTRLTARALPMREVHALSVAPDGTIGVGGVYDRASAEHPDLPMPHNFDSAVALYEADLRARAQTAIAGPDFEYLYGLGADEPGFRATGHYGEFGNGVDIGAFHLDSSGGHHAFLAHIASDGSVLDASALRGAGVIGRAVARHPSGTWVVAGILRPGPLEPPDLPPVSAPEGPGFFGFVYVGWD